MMSRGRFRGLDARYRRILRASLVLSVGAHAVAFAIARLPSGEASSERQVVSTETAQFEVAVRALEVVAIRGTGAEAAAPSERTAVPDAPARVAVRSPSVRGSGALQPALGELRAMEAEPPLLLADAGPAFPLHLEQMGRAADRERERDGRGRGGIRVVIRGRGPADCDTPVNALASRILGRRGSGGGTFVLRLGR